MEKLEALNLKVPQVVRSNRTSRNQCGRGNNHIRDAAGLPLTAKLRLQVPCLRCDRSRNRNPLETRQERLRGSLFTRPKPAVQLGNTDRRSNQFLSGRNQTGKQYSSLLPISERVDQYGCIQHNLRRLAHSGSRFSSRPASRALGSFRTARTHSAVPSSTKSGWSSSRQAGSSLARKANSFRRLTSLAAVSTRKLLRPRGPTSSSISLASSAGIWMWVLSVAIALAHS